MIAYSFMMNISHAIPIWLGLAVCMASTIVLGPIYAQDQERNPLIIIHRQTGDEIETNTETERVSTGSSVVDVEDLRKEIASLQKELSDKDRRLERMQKAIDEASAELNKSEESLLSQKAKTEELRAGGKEMVQNIHELNVLIRRQQKELKSALQNAYESQEDAEKLKEEVAIQRAFLLERTREVDALKELLAQRRGVVDPGPSVANIDGVDILEDAHNLLAEGKIEMAAQKFRQGQARWPDESAFQVGLATCHYEEKNFAIAKALLEDVVKDERDNAEAHGLLGLVNWREGDLRRASRHLGRAAREQPNIARWYIYRGMVLYGLGRIHDAMKSLDKAIKINPLNPEAQFNLAVLLAQANEPDLIQARVHYEEALRLGSPPDGDVEKIIYAP